MLCVTLAGPWCPDMWSNMLLAVPVKVFWMRLTLKLVDLEGSGLFSIMWVGLVHLRPEQNRKAHLPEQVGIQQQAALNCNPGSSLWGLDGRFEEERNKESYSVFGRGEGMERESLLHE